MSNIKQMREKYEQIKANNPKRASSARSQVSQSRLQAEMGHSQQRLQNSQSLLCSPCYNKKLYEQREYMKRQQNELEKNLMKRQLDINLQEEQYKSQVERQQIINRKQIEQFNLQLSSQFQLKKQEMQSQQKAQEIEFERQVIRKNLDIEEQEKIQRLKKIQSLGQQLKEQIEEKKRLTQQDFHQNNGIIDDPYWRHQSQGEKEVLQRKNYQQQYVNNNWTHFERERLKKINQSKLDQEKDIQDRVKALREYHLFLQQEKQEKMNSQRQLILDLTEQVKRKKERDAQEKQINQRLQRERDQQDLLQQQERELKEIKNKKSVSQQMILGLENQLSYKKSNQRKTQEDSCNNTLLLQSQINKQLVPCSKCKKCQDPQFLSIL
ncbi:unnamed protein product [Paramecium pentaurelia]|uniref:Uncharacterized protein n=1 Tax=Paramecium pentaurelia TaxID=43138 RepID=A0A8S1Y7W3_9CILI|nr:unnamed protein product [Paramecium pentaurelia]